MLPCTRHLLANHDDLKVDDFYFANGIYSDVWKASLRGEHVVIKVWRGALLSHASRGQFSKVVLLSSPLFSCSETYSLQKLADALDVWKKVRHPNIVPFLGITMDSGPLPSPVMPLYENGHVMNYLSKNPLADILTLVNIPTLILTFQRNALILNGRSA
jgi:hypothetical protein